MFNTILLLSIKPQYAEKIFSGEKQVELRRVRTRLKNGDLVLVYVSSPKKALVGTFEVSNIIQNEIQKLPKDLNDFWQEIENIAGISPSEFKSYYNDASLIVAIFIKNIKILPIPIKLEILREKIPKFQPPQSYRYLNKSEFKLFESIIQDNTAISSINK
ncbi:ASCH domain-containing protein [Cylindrospermum sp. FACHB-282]|uniref:ASCH domain-containing protein n=1 Tax=Cylindrospermum sp. FACHB-282 TaxID=2692794 RepID=UPI0016893648|nr:ASCH domain-containing protein [Cylindrospermum sp. FACHB-282]MBD2388835.1 ASCH domain-containing protein [Cylindrospermum sp. FACHB-282]